MSEYIPKFNKNDRELLILDNMFVADDCAEYASRHNLNVLFTETTSASSVEVMMKFQKKGYSIEMYEKDVYAPDGLKLNPKIYVLFTKKENTEKTEATNLVKDQVNDNIAILIDELVSQKVSNLGSNCPYWQLNQRPCDEHDRICEWCKEEWGEKVREQLTEKYTIK